MSRGEPGEAGGCPTCSDGLAPKTALYRPRGRGRRESRQESGCLWRATRGLRNPARLIHTKPQRERRFDLRTSACDVDRICHRQTRPTVSANIRQVPPVGFRQVWLRTGSRSGTGVRVHCPARTADKASHFPGRARLHESGLAGMILLLSASLCPRHTSSRHIPVPVERPGLQRRRGMPPATEGLVRETPGR